MGNPGAYLPPALSDDAIHDLLSSLGLPAPITIRPLQVTAASHSIYLLNFPPSASAHFHNVSRNEDGSTTLVLRVSGNHIPSTKTNNEVGVMRWVRENTSIPIPEIIAFDSTRNNALEHEFTLLECVKGRSVDKMYNEISEEVKMKTMRQLADYLIELNGHRWSHCGGLKIDSDGNTLPGPVLEDNFWMGQEIEQLWGENESVTTLNPTGPYASHSELINAFLETYIHCIEVHPTLTWLTELNPRLRALQDRLPSVTSLNETPLILAHKDLHFCNIMATPEGDITGILDWEFAGVVPANRWDPVRAFLWNGQQSDEAKKEKYRLSAKFEEELGRRGVERWWEVGDDVKGVWEVLSFVRALVEVCPRGQSEGLVEGWRDAAERTLTKLGVD